MQSDRESHDKKANTCLRQWFPCHRQCRSWVLSRKREQRPTGQKEGCIAPFPIQVATWMMTLTPRPPRRAPALLSFFVSLKNPHAGIFYFDFYFLVTHNTTPFHNGEPGAWCGGNNERFYVYCFYKGFVVHEHTNNGVWLWRNCHRCNSVNL